MTGEELFRSSLDSSGCAPQNDRGEGGPQNDRGRVIPNGVRNLRSPSDGLPITTTVFRVRRHLRDSLNKSPWMRRREVKPVPTEGARFPPSRE